MQNKRMKRLLGNGFYLNVKFDQKTADSNKNGTEARDQYKKVDDWELFDIKEGETLYSYPNRTKSNHSHVLSSLNGVKDTSDTELYNKCLFEGIAQTEHRAEKTPQIDQGLVSCVSGVITIINDSGTLIRPGDLLYLTVPSDKKKYNRGIHPGKQRFCLAPMSSTTIARLLFKKLQERRVFNYSSIDKRQVAKAMSRASKGEKLDILLYPRT